MKVFRIPLPVCFINANYPIRFDRITLFIIELAALSAISVQMMLLLQAHYQNKNHSISQCLLILSSSLCYLAFYLRFLYNPHINISQTVSFLITCLILYEWLSIIVKATCLFERPALLNAIWASLTLLLLFINIAFLHTAYTLVVAWLVLMIFFWLSYKYLRAFVIYENYYADTLYWYKKNKISFPNATIQNKHTLLNMEQDHIVFIIEWSRILIYEKRTDDAIVFLMASLSYPQLKPRQKSAIIFNLGIAYYYSNQFKSSLDLFEKSMKVYGFKPKSDLFYVIAAYSYSSAHLMAKYYRSKLNRYLNPPDELLFLDGLISYNEKQYITALKFILQTKNLNPCIMYHYYLWQLYLELQEAGKANHHLIKAAALRET